MTTRFLLAAAAAAVATLAACGGSDDAPAQPPAATHEVPAAAMASTAALVDWGATLPASETLEPLDIATAMPPVSDTEEPRPLR